MISFLPSRVKAYISNGWDKRIVDPDPNKLYTQKQTLKDADNEELDGVPGEDHDHVSEDWPKGPYTQQIQGVLPPLLTEELIITHSPSSGKWLKKDSNYSNVDYSTLQREHQYFMESYISGKHIRFCCKDGAVWVQARCYRSQKKE